MTNNGRPRPVLFTKETAEEVVLARAECDLTDQIELAQPPVSHHLKALTKAGSSPIQARNAGLLPLVPDAVQPVSGLLVSA